MSPNRKDHDENANAKKLLNMKWDHLGLNTYN